MNDLSGFDCLAHPLGEWLKGTGPESDVVISTRVRLARNVSGFPFTARADARQRFEVLRLATEALRSVHLEKASSRLTCSRSRRWTATSWSSAT